jgi:hypothetical protein
MHAAKKNADNAGVKGDDTHSISADQLARAMLRSALT